VGDCCAEETREKAAVDDRNIPEARRATINRLATLKEWRVDYKI